MIARIVSLLFLIGSIAALILVIFSDKKWIKVIRAYVIATTIVYITGNLLIAGIMWVFANMPVVFTIIAEISILFVYDFTLYILFKLGTSFDELKKDNSLKDSNSKSDMASPDIES